jgi:hypothetical protein
MNDEQLISRLGELKVALGGDLPESVLVVEEAIQRIKDYAEVQQSHDRLVRQLDVLWNGEEDAAQQAQLVDMVKQIEHDISQFKPNLLSRITIRALRTSVDKLRGEFNKIQPDLREARRYIAFYQFIVRHDVEISSDEGCGDGPSTWTVKVPCGNRNDRDMRHFRGGDLMDLIEQAQRVFS